MQKRLESLGVHFDEGGRNTYPDFCLVEKTEGFEIKGLAYPGREKNYDANSNVPSGFHNGLLYFMFLEDTLKIYQSADLMVEMNIRL